MNWINNRPEGWEYGAWKKDEQRLRDPPVVIEERLYNAYEAGADALYESAYAKGRAEGIGNFLREFFCQCYPEFAGKLKEEED